MTDTLARTGASRIPAGVPELIQHYIDGAWRPSLGAESFEVLEPATNSVYTRCAAGQAVDVDRAVAAARRAFVDGPGPAQGTGGPDLVRVADGIDAADGRLAELEAFDTGLPISQARGQAHRAAENFRFFADMIVTLNEDAFRVGEDQLNYVVRKPIGVAGLITPWNTPFMLETWKLAPALASGCTVVLKPAEWSPLSAGMLAEIMADAGVPPGVFNIVHGIGEEAGAALVDHPDVPVISFTGETTTGKIIAATPRISSRCRWSWAASRRHRLRRRRPRRRRQRRRLPDIQPQRWEHAPPAPGCWSTARLRRVVERVARAGHSASGLPSEIDRTRALIHRNCARVVGCVRRTRRRRRLVAGGTAPADSAAGTSRRTVFADVKRTDRIFREEIFGPVLAIAPFDTEAEAVSLANDSRYGLAAYIWTRDLRRAHRLAQRIESGMLWVNSQNVRDLRTPFGG
jgi:5-carboxymethyl-2-hydroxymuconic-semialdehyde dehydrogenase